MSFSFDSPASAYAWLDGHINYERNLGSVRYGERTFELESFRSLLKNLGDPHRGIRAIHIAGSCGKGSSALMLEALLRASGQNVATYMSPHIREYRERIRLNGEPISGETFCRLLEQAAQTGYAKDDGKRTFKTVFEFLTTIFFLAARQAKVDWMVVETGLGGRLDATNVLDPGPVLFTRIGMEHTHLLGPTIEAIAGEKAAILKPGGWGIVAAQEGATAGKVFERRSSETGAPVEFAERICPLTKRDFNGDGMKLTYTYKRGDLSLSLPWFGPFLSQNLQGALAVMEGLQDRELLNPISNEELEESLVTMHLPGRMEPAPGYPKLLADSGHCPPAARGVAETMAAHFPHGKAVAVVGMASDKDHPGFLEALAGWKGWEGLICYRIESPRVEPAESLAGAGRRFFPSAECCDNIRVALELAGKRAEKENSLIVATGSTYSVASALDWAKDHGGKHTPTQNRT